MSFDAAGIYSLLYARVATDSAGSTIRGLLGTKTAWGTLTGISAAVIPFQFLEQAKGLAVPTPWLVWHPSGIVGPSGGMRDLQASWWAYTDNNEEALLAIVDQLDLLYGSTAKYSLAGGIVSVIYVGQPGPDGPADSRLVIETRIAYTKRG